MTVFEGGGARAVRWPFGGFFVVASACCHRDPFEDNQAAHVVGQVLHPDLDRRPDDADGADELSTHGDVLVSEDMLDCESACNIGSDSILMKLAFTRG